MAIDFQRVQSVFQAVAELPPAERAAVLEREGPPGPQRPAKLLPQDWSEAQLLRREAEEMLRIKRSR